ncbi:TetR/AcrR family transcriptional regulator [Sediminibacillus albus]|uniref:DNA-binding transcriptional regulator, AcrR family n=1 Tax=Sediminibacillus albus TaxID=407036 RepID=A0A1G8VVB0_9BACI|nr:TetR/AcrR family transcriptional regulator [Sediminibacillus albus]SDJ70028.1 DNA-binding transcriptional regulator, AcrR family [Sediminibacillus albus]
MSELRDSIIDTALTLFEEHGFHGVTVSRIVEVTGTSKGGFYHHFHSKDELLFVIHDTFITYVLEKATLARETQPTPTKKLQTIIKEFVKVFDLYKPHISVFYQESIYLRPEYGELIKKKRDQFKTILFEVIKEGKTHGEFRYELPLEITVMAILGMVNWTYKWYHHNGKYSIEDIADIFVDLILHGILEHHLLQKEAYHQLLLQEPFFYHN